MYEYEKTKLFNKKVKKALIVFAFVCITIITAIVIVGIISHKNKSEIKKAEALVLPSSGHGFDIKEVGSFGFLGGGHIYEVTDKKTEVKYLLFRYSDTGLAVTKKY